ncbi:hypothetical protein HC823_01855, partial [Candidatus Gracilibacteria bacterium]|nr:hypothetical protein [Candidatus Gracilibacteria bacterium]
MKKTDMEFDFQSTEGRYLGKLFVQAHPKFLLDHLAAVVKARLFQEKYLAQLVRRAGKASPNGILENRESVESLGIISIKELNAFCVAAQARQAGAVQTVIGENPYWNPGRFLKDPALALWLDVLTYAEKSLTENDIAKGISIEEKSLLIARYLYMQGFSISTPGNIKQAVAEIVKRKKTLKKVPLFQGREVVFVANNEDTKKYGGERF